MIWGGYFLAYTCLVSRSCWNSDFRGSRFLLILDVNIGFDAESKHSNTPTTISSAKTTPTLLTPAHWPSVLHNTVVWLTQQLEYFSIVADHVKSGAAAIARGPVSIQLAGQYLAAKEHIIHVQRLHLWHTKREIEGRNKIWENTNGAVGRVYSEADL